MKLFVRNRGVTFTALLILVFISIYAGFKMQATFRDSLNERWKQQLLFSTGMTAGNLESYFVQLSGALVYLANDPRVADCLKNRDFDNVYRPLETVYNTYKDKVSTVLLLDTGSRIIRRYPALPGNLPNTVCPGPVPLLSEIARDVVLSDVFKNKMGKEAVSLTCPVFADEKVIGYVKYVILLEKLSVKIIDTSSRQGETVVHVFSSKKQELIMAAPSDTLSAMFTDELMWNKLKSVGGYGVLSIRNKAQSTVLLSGFKKIRIHGNEWIVFVSVPYGELDTALKHNGMIVFLITFLIVVIALFMLYTLLKTRQEKQAAEFDAAHQAALARAAHTLESERKYRLKASIDARESEQKRISRDLHDGLGQLLLAIRLKIEDFRRNDPKRPQPREYLLQMIDRAVAEVKSISNHLHPPVFNDLGIDAVMEQLSRESGSALGCKVEYVSYGTAYLNDNQVKSYLYRIAQEALANAIKHSRAIEVNLQLLCTFDHATMIVQDNGIGFDPGSPGTGNGLANIRDRVSLLDGTLSIESLPNTGTTITIRIPLNTGNDEIR